MGEDGQQSHDQLDVEPDEDDQEYRDQYVIQFGTFRASVAHHVYRTVPAHPRLSPRFEKRRCRTVQCLDPSRVEIHKEHVVAQCRELSPGHGANVAAAL